MKNLLLLCGMLLLCHTAHARPKNGGDKDSTRHAVKNPLAETQTLRSFPELDSYLQQNGSLNTLLNVPNAAIAEFTQDYITTNFSVSDLVADNRSQAAQTFAELDRLGSYVDNISPQDLVSLPVGMRKKLGTTSVTVGIAKAKFTNTYAELTIFCKIDLPQGKTIFFGADKVQLTKNGGIFGNARLVLLGDFQIPINGGNSMIILKGGLDMSTGNVNDVNITGITVNCSGVEDLKVAADVVLPRSLVEPVDANLKVISDQSVKVKGTILAGQSLSDWNNFYAEIDIPTKFVIHGLDKVAFQVKKAYFDFSDGENPPLPTNYPNKGLDFLWRGVFIQEIKAYLPKEFKKKGTTDAVTITGNDIIVDNWGFSGLISATTTPVLQDGTASGWDFSVDRFEINVQANSLRGAGFQGSIAIPLAKTTKLAYSAIFTADNGYMLRVALKQDLPFDLWRARVNLKEGSRVELTARDGAFRPKANLTGTMGIEIVENGKAEASLQGITFENLVLQTEAPYLSGGEFGYATTGSHVSNFPFSISSLVFNLDQLSLTAGLSLNLMEGNFAASGTVTVFGKRADATDGTIGYEYSKIELNEIAAHADFGSFMLDGKLQMMRNHKTMGNGVKGRLQMVLKLQSGNAVGIEVAAAFGTTLATATTEAYRYWYVDALASFPAIPVAPGLDLVGLGGGASYHMKKLKDDTKHDAENTFTKVAYDPNINEGLGLRAMVSLAVTGDGGYVDACLEMAFHPKENGGGVKHIGLFGRGKFMTKESNQALKADVDMKSKLEKGLSTLTDNVSKSDANPATVAALKAGNFTAIANNTDLNVVPDEKMAESRTSTVYATLAIDYDFVSKTLTGNFDIDLLVGQRSQPTMVGTGKMRLKFAPNEWYIYIGEPDLNKRVSITMNFAAATANLNAYFVIGSNIPNSPPPPAAVASILGQKADALNYMRNLNALSSGAGFAFGASLSVQTGDVNFLIFYAKFDAGVGFDVMVRKYPGATYTCGGATHPLGMNGWYANGQAYAYMQGELGVKITVFGSEQKVPIIKGGAAILLQAKLPNPSWFTGYMAGYYSVLGGLFKGTFNMKIVLGNDCTLNPVAPAGPDIKFINTITPDDQTTGVDVTAIPQVTFSQPINTPFYVSIPNPNDPNNPNYDVYKAVLNEFKVKQGSTDVTGTYTTSTYEDAMSFTGTNLFTPNTTYSINVSVKFEKRTSAEGVTPATWENYLVNGQPFIESKPTTTFTTGVSEGIPLSNIEYSYPVVGQKYFLPGESSQGVIKLKRRIDSLLNPSRKILITITNYSTPYYGKQIQANYNSATNEILFTLPPDIPLSNNMYIHVLTQPLVYDGTGMYIFDDIRFSTSKYNTFAQKMADKFNVATSLTEYAPSDPTIPLLGATGRYDEEPFEMNELRGTAATGNKPLIEAKADLTNQYYTDRIGPMLYDWQNTPNPPYRTWNSKVTDYPPTKTIGILPAYEQALLGTTDNTTTPTVDLKSIMPFRYMAAQYYKSDYSELRLYLPMKYMTCTTTSGKINCRTEYPYYLTDLASTPEHYFPQMPSGGYGTTFKYVLPNGQAGTSYNFFFRAPAPQQWITPVTGVTVDRANNNSMVVGNLIAPHVNVDVYRINNNNGWENVFSCNDNCGGEELTVATEPTRDYIVNVKMFTQDWRPIGERNITADAPPPPLPSCDNVTVAVQGTTMTIDNLTAPHQNVNIYRVLANGSWIPVYDCNDTCGQTTSATISYPYSRHIVLVKMFNSQWGLICEKQIQYQP